MKYLYFQSFVKGSTHLNLRKPSTFNDTKSFLPNNKDIMLLSIIFET